MESQFNNEDFLENAYAAPTSKSDLISLLSTQNEVYPLTERKPSESIAKYVLPSNPVNRKSLAFSNNTSIKSVGSFFKCSTNIDDDKMHWVGTGETLQVGNFLIENPMVYCSKSKDLHEASCILLNATLGKEASNDGLGYWPHYHQATAGQKTYYLNWLAQGKQTTLSDIGFAFLFFYGLERRVLLEGQDSIPVLKEVIRLLKIYRDSYSFQSYLTNFATFIVANESLKKTDFTCLDFLSELSPEYCEHINSLLLAYFAEGQTPLPVKYAYLFARFDPLSSHSVVIERVEEHFKSLFDKKYAQAFGKGILLQSSKDFQQMQYQPANPSLIKTSTILPSANIPKVVDTKNQLHKLSIIWNECIEELRPLNRILQKGSEITSKEAYMALPKDLREQADHPNKPEWEKLLSEHVQEDGFIIVPVSKLIEVNKIFIKNKLTLAQSIECSTMANVLGLAIMPDAKLERRSYALEDYVALIPLEKETTTGDDTQHRLAMTMLELGIAIADADGIIHKEETEYIKLFLQNHFELTPHSSYCLKAYLVILSLKPLTISQSMKRLKPTLNAVQKEQILKFLVGVSTANGVIHAKQLASLKKISIHLKVDTFKLESLLHNLLYKDIVPVEIQSGKASKQGELLPERLKPKQETSILLNEVYLRQIIEETSEVSVLLENALRETELKEKIIELKEPSLTVPASSTTNIPIINKHLSLLDSRYHAALAELINMECLNSNEFHELARKHGLMTASLLDTINSWSDEHLGDFLLIEGPSLTINKAILENSK